jgi:hypothetical protein
MDRPTKEITTPGGVSVVVKTYLTAREVNDTLKQILGTTGVSPDTKIELSAVVGIDRNIKLVEAAVVSLDGSTENIPERLGDLPINDWQFILKEAGLLADGNF